MDNQRAFLLNWSCLYQEKSMDELKQNLLLAMELENTRVQAQEELKMRDQQIAQLKELLNTAIKERDEAQEKCQRMFLEKILLQQQLQKWQQSAQHSGISSIEDDPKRGIESNNGFSSSDCDESIVSPPPPTAAADEEPELPIAINRALPEKGKLLQAVMKAGPLLQTLLLAGPLPQWRHPPPPLDSYQIPPPPVVVPPPPPPPPLPTPSIFQDSLQSINNCGRINRKRGLSEGSDSSGELKYQRVVLQ